MVEPEDFGLSPAATLSRIADTSRPSRHGAFWKTWNTAVYAETPRLTPREVPDLSDSTATHEFTSARHVRIGCALALPRGRPTAGLIVLHGYETPDPLEETLRRFRPLVERKVALLCLRVRGFPGSQVDVPRLVEHTGAPSGGRWITHGLEVPISESGFGCEWSFSYAVADVVNACRGFRSLLDRQVTECPIFMYGQSFGAALAIIATSQLTDRDPSACPSRLAIALPSMGDWPWRLAQKPTMCRGIGGEVQRFLMEYPHLHGQTVEMLRTFDTVLHARRIRCPVLCKLAILDDVVPAPTAAAVFNALATDPGLKRRFVTRYGHFDGGIADLRRHAAFERLVDAFLDPAADPADALVPEAALAVT